MEKVVKQASFDAIHATHCNLKIRWSFWSEVQHTLVWIPSRTRVCPYNFFILVFVVLELVFNFFCIFGADFAPALWWVCKKDFLFFLLDFFGTRGGHILVVGPVTWVHKTHKLRAPKTQYNDLVFYSCRIHLQLTTMSDNLDFIKFHLLLQYGPYMVPG